VAPSDAQLAERSARERILDATCELIAQRGIGGARIAQIARAAGVSTALVHYHFRTREALLAAALDHAFDLTSDVRVRPPDVNGDGGSAARRLADVVERSLPSTEPVRGVWLLWAELWLGAARDPDLRPIAAQLYARYRSRMRASIAEGIAAGDFADVDAGTTADLAMALIDGVGLRVLTADPSMPLADARELIGRVLARELRIPAGRLPFAAVGGPAHDEGRGARAGL
jgi:AcrR family transcriptional regulator